MSRIPFDDLPDCAVIRQPVVLAVTGYSKATLWNHIRDGKFPQPVQIGPRSIAWRVSDIRKLLASFTTKQSIDKNVAKATAVRQAKRALLAEGAAS
ncbi:AlpA family transcriptional regulator [Pseudomonas sp. R5(2019)]|uniref:helix-turn-helix transcriptional regulator n=1 Tax=Pseudomonas sp. R5(2019) TaxID=2697566 RepID=UPI0014136DFF|nr:AlpA family phage regulatory protein [Pseudomonas sp. R5(2019)]NBA96296.1 AlpA family phage regulatory protein [Pseudomonas sp. R5(2019)]